MKVHVEGKGPVEMQHLNLGDKVLVANGAYETIYSFGHISRDTQSDFLRLHTQSSVLELSKDHMVYVVDKPVPIPADQVKAGDTLKVFDGLDDSAEDGLVKKVTSLSRKGLFSPLTASGTIVVNNIVASTFTAISEDDEAEYTSTLKVKGVEIVSNQMIAHIWETPSRVLRTVMGWKEESYVKGTYSLWTFVGLRLAKDILLPHGALGGLAVCAVVLSILPLYAIEWFVRSLVVMGSVGWMMGLMVAGLAFVGSRRVQINMCKVKKY